MFGKKLSNVEGLIHQCREMNKHAGSLHVGRFLELLATDLAWCAGMEMKHKGPSFFKSPVSRPLFASVIHWN